MEVLESTRGASEITDINLGTPREQNKGLVHNIDHNK